MQEWRHYLYYTLGFLPSLFFGLRFLIQWLKSEKEGRSTIDSLFWTLSITGNILLATHYFIQLQYPFLILQVTNAFIAWRNLNFLQLRKKPYSLNVACSLLGFLLLAITLLYSLQKNPLWLQPPEAIGYEALSLYWHLLGILGGICFGARFWVQWIESEKTGKSRLNKHFWILSIVGSALSLVYFVRINDIVSVLMSSFGLIPYLRNLVLIRRTSRS